MEHTKEWSLNASQKEIIFLNMEKCSADLELKNTLINIWIYKSLFTFLQIKPIEFK